MNSKFDNVYLFLASLVLLGICELIYFRIAEQYKVIDKPNQRSSHSIPTIRGGGIIFVFACVAICLITGTNFLFMTGCVIIGAVSFVDDIREEPPALRLGVQLVAILLLMLQTNFFENPLWLVPLALVITVGTVNAFNFMDGINGITGIYALVNLSTFLYVDAFVFPFVGEDVLIVLLAGVLVFLFFNFRKKARCFAGDVGSVTLAYVQAFLLLQLIQRTQTFGWLLMLLIFGVDSVVTIVLRLVKKQNIFQPHRTHLYQYLANELKISHRVVAVGYGIMQLIINGVTLFFVQQQSGIFTFILLGGIYLSLYIIARILIYQLIAKQLRSI